MIPANLKYQSKVESAPSRRYLTQIQPQGGTSFGQADTITINIPTRNNTALIPSDSYLRGQINIVVSAVSGTPTAALESCGVHNFIQRLRVFHGSNLLEDIDNYGQLAKILYDYQAPEDAVKGRFSITTGTNSAYSTVSPAAPGDALNARSVNRGSIVSITGAGTTVIPFAINLVSLVGALAGDKYLPLWEMTAAPLRLELVLQSNAFSAMMLNSITVTNYTVTGVNYCGEFLELPDSAVSAIKSASSSPMQMVLPSWRSYTNSAALASATQTQVSFPIPAKFSSLKNIVVATRGPLAGTTQHYPSSHCAFGVGSSSSSGYQFRIGSEVLPSTQPTSFPEIYTETLKCFGSLADLQVQPSIDKDAFELNVPGAAITTVPLTTTTDSGAFLIGIDLETYQNADKSAIFSGMNTNNSDCFAIINYYAPSALTVRQTAFACYDQVLVYENGVCYARY